ncbi:hypothetical protein LTR91_015343 [Friedmanniomyces endolithicus]|uniref:RGS domain-containing protein n=1 Tax=Friedmanniomyces endolithicus TaxID=329885 RepID=A0AAN6QM83_9PEZI|nr:hypothetical protein LTR94_006392 [Friedmanniomyces endolithicus]KAK0801189.1 hypothetical protein LTR59_005482 [Friedmanniomyces endolithicus]KAK0808207.1 hypothetical protein LTR38_004672 [Friedmanniomyces endolithicus]KAK0809104.1 hypothetical protein LTR75_006047 [Friedmanniomyces endolithicus]KAK0847956.1 hypothetical protein LTR03_006082 [Friedmanniomyces endolithicus]
MGLNPKGRNWGSLVNWDDLGKAYAAVLVIWTVTLCAGTAWLVVNRRIPFIKMRNLPLALASTAFLHVYLVKIMLAYTTNGHLTCAAEFWIMSIYLPFGIALFQANITQLRSISYRQSRILSRQMSETSFDSLPSVKKGSKMSKVPNVWTRWRSLNDVEKSYVFIGFFMLVQIVMTGALYATSPTLQGDWSSYGDIPYAKGQSRCRKSLEWIPSAFWQLFWSWVYGPYVLYKIKNIHDAHHWRLQTVLSIVSGLPGTPLWIASVFTPGGKFHPVNIWWVPSMWLAPGIIVMQFCTVFFPIYEFYEHKKAVSAIWSDAQWEKQENRPHLPPSVVSSRSSVPSSQRQLLDNSTAKLFEALAADSMADGKELYRMAALEKALLINPTPLLHFAATKDFTAENIIFLLHVKEWRAAWRTAPRDPQFDRVTPQAHRRLFNMALDIFAASISAQTAEFPVNLEGPTVHALARLFEPHMASSRSGTSGSDGSDQGTLVGSWEMSPHQHQHQQQRSRSTAFDMEMTPSGPKLLWPPSHDRKIGLLDVSITPVSQGSSIMAPSTAPAEGGENQDDEAEKGNQPMLASVYPDIDERVFDEAEASIRYLVLTNTWRKFVKAREDAMDV